MATAVATKLADCIRTAAEQQDFGPNHWTIYDAETNGAVSSTLAGVENVQHIVTQIIVSFSAVPAAACTLTITSASTQIYPAVHFGVTVAGPVVIGFPRGLQCAVGETLTLALSSPGNVTASVGALGYSSPGPQGAVSV
jgi:hypothetical protein